jgi:hypothetical protein
MVNKTLILIAALSQSVAAASSQTQEALFTTTPICWDDPRYELRSDFKWAIHTPSPVRVVMVLKGCKGKNNRDCDERECMYFSTPKQRNHELKG